MWRLACKILVIFWVGHVQAALTIGPLSDDVLLRDVAVEFHYAHPKVSVPQIMYAIDQTNPNVFSGSGIFMPHPGEQLYIPDVNTIRVIAPIKRADQWLVDQVASAPIPRPENTEKLNRALQGNLDLSKHALYTKLVTVEDKVERLMALDQSIVSYQHQTAQTLKLHHTYDLLSWGWVTQNHSEFTDWMILTLADVRASAWYSLQAFVSTHGLTRFEINAAFILMSMLFVFLIFGRYSNALQVPVEPPQKKKSPNATRVNQPTDQATEQSYIAQIHLARAYIEMAQYQIARDILKNVIKNGSLDEKEGAESCLAQIDQLSN